MNIVKDVFLCIICIFILLNFSIISFIKVLSKVASQAKSAALKNILCGLDDQAYYIKQLHDELFDKIKPAAENQTTFNVADVFVQMKVKFLIYAPFIVHCGNVEKMLELMKIDKSVKQDVQALEDHLQAEMNKNNNFNHPTSFNSLLAFPFQHVIR